jgi:hypothetical protein
VEIFVFAVEFVGAMLLGVFVVAGIILPIFYGAPVAFYWSIKGRLRFASVLHYVVSALIWLVVVSAVVYAISFFSPKLFWHLARSEAVTYGFPIGFVIMVGRAFMPAGRADLWRDFGSAMEKYRR